jgi:hypothetical protein
VKSGTSLKRRCQYQAVVMNTLEPSSSKIGSRYGDRNGAGMECASTSGEGGESAVVITPGKRIGTVRKSKLGQRAGSCDQHPGGEADDAGKSLQ